MGLQDKTMISRCRPLLLLPLLFGACSQPAPPPPAAAVMPRPSTLGQADAAFATSAAQSSLFAIEMSRVAAQKAGRKGIRDFADQIVDTQTASATRLAAITQGKGLTLAPALTSEQAAAVRTLAGMPDGARFRRLYFSDLVKSHLTSAKQMDAFAKTTSDLELRSYATDQALLLRQQIATARSLPKAGSPT